MKNILKQNQQGISTVIAVVAVVVIAAVLAGAFFVLNRNKDDSTSNNEVQSACETYYNDKDFCRFASNFSLGGEYKMTSTSSDEDTVSVIESDGSGNSRITASKNGTTESSSIIIGKSSYTLDVTTGQWTKFTMQDDNQAATPDLSKEFDNNFKFNEEAEQNSSTLKKLGKENCGDLNCFKYEITDNEATDGVITYLFDDKDYKLRKVTNTEAGKVHTTTFDYNIEPITEPSPVVEMPTIDENMNPEQLQQLLEQYGQ